MSEPSDGIGLDGWTHTVVHAKDGRRAVQADEPAAYYRFLRASSHPGDEAHRRHYLFRIATNLARDAHRRRVKGVEVALPADDAHDAIESGGDVARGASAQVDLSRAMAQLNARERDLLWLAYAA